MQKLEFLVIATKQTRFKGPEALRFKSHSAPFLPKAKKEDSSFDESLVAEMGFEPHDLRVMSPTSCQTAPLRDINGAGSRGRTGTRKNLTGF